jgi:signal transduction histidine kinase
MVQGGLERLRHLSLKGKVTLTLTAVFATIVTVFLLVLVPFMRQQRHRLLERDKRFLSTLRDNYQRRFIHDLLSENAESLAVDVADLARQSGILWVRIEAEGVELSATAEPALIRKILALPVPPEGPGESPVLLIREPGWGDLVGVGGRPLLQDHEIDMTALPEWGASSVQADAFETGWEGEPALRLDAELRAADEGFGRLALVYSLAPLRRSEALTNTIFYGLVGTSFVLLLVLLNVFIARIVIGPLQRVLAAMSQASKGELSTRLPVFSRDEIGTMAESFNSMVAELEASKREVDAYSRELETRVEKRTRELRSSEANLLAVKNHLATVIATVATGVISLDEQGRIETFNERAGEILSVRIEAIEGKRLEEVLHGVAGQEMIDFVGPVLEGRAGARNGQISYKLPPGRRTLSVVASTLWGEGRQRQGTVVVFDDLTQILASQRLETWKQAVERVIHEIKNPLTPVGLAAQTLRAAYSGDRDKFDEIFPSATEMILGAVRDLKELISEFTLFSRLPKVQLRPQDLNDLVSDALSLYEHGPVDGIEVRSVLADGLPGIEADPDQLKRVLLNVINNGIEAMEGQSGELTVTTRGPDPSGLVTVSVCDQGPGVEDADRIFEPHYTTKAKGTGLGLAIARQIVEDHGGEIHAESELDAGTTVSIVLPSAATSSTPDADDRESSAT